MPTPETTKFSPKVGVVMTWRCARKINCEPFSAFAFMLYLLLCILFLGTPNGFNYVSSMPIERDPAFYLWSFKWWPYALSHHLNPFLTNAFWAPFGQNLAWTASVPSLAIPLWPVTATLGTVFSYNLINIISLTLAGYFVYLLCKELKLDYLPSLFGGLVFFFSSYTWAQLIGHLNLDVTFAIPFLVYLFVARLNHKISRIGFIIFWSLLLAFQFGVSEEIYSTFVTFGFIAYAVAYWVSRKVGLAGKLRTVGMESVGAIVVSVMLLAPYIFYILKGYFPGAMGQIILTDPINFIIPTPTTWLLGNFFRSISSQFSGNFSEEGAYLGLPLIIIVFDFVRREWDSRWCRYIIVMLAILFICSLGSYLTVLNHKLVVLPWFLLSKLPILDKALPSRFTLYISLLVSIILAVWMQRAKISKPIKVAAVLLSIAFLLPNTFAIYKGTVHIPEFFTSGTYKQFIKRDENVLILPAYGQGGLAPIYQAQSNFYFNVAQGYAGIVPKQLSNSSIPGVLYGSELPLGYASAFDSYLLKCKITKIISVGHLDDTSEKLVNTLGMKPEKVDDVLIYNITKGQITSEYIKNTDAAFNLKKSNIDILRGAAKAFYDKYKTFNNLYPLNLEKMGFLSKSFGGYPKSARNYNWTSNGFFIGKWGELYAVGFVTTNPYMARLIFDNYSKQSSIICFPYPEVYSPLKTGNLDSEGGFMLMVFKE